MFFFLGTVDSSLAHLTVLTDSASLVIPIHIHTESKPIHFRIVETLGGMAITLTGCTTKLQIVTISKMYYKYLYNISRIDRLQIVQ